MKSIHKQTECDTLVTEAPNLTRTISLKLSESLYTKFLLKCKQLKRTKSDTARLALEDYVNQTEDSS